VASKKSSKAPPSKQTDPPPFLLTPPTSAPVRRPRAEFVPGSTGEASVRRRVPRSLWPPLDQVLAKMTPLEELSIAELNKNLLRLQRRRNRLHRTFPHDRNAVEQSAREEIRDADLLIQRTKLALIRKDRLETTINRPRAIGITLVGKGKKTQIADANSIDRDRPAPGDRQSRLPKEPLFSPSDDYRSVRFDGNEYLLTLNQSKIVRCLHDAHARKHPNVAKARLLSAIGSETSEIRDSFRKSPLWKTLVVSGGRRGTYRLKLPDTW